MSGEFADWRRLASQLEGVKGASVVPFYQAVEVTARHIKDDWNDALPSSGRLRGTSGSVDYDIQADGVSGLLNRASGVSAEIGPNLQRGQGAMAGWFEDGTEMPNNSIPALHPGELASRANMADFENGVAKAAVDAMRRSIG